MSARRQARGRNTGAVVTGAGGVPRVFLVGRCIDVWAEAPDDNTPGMGVADMQSATRRFATARSAWLDLVGVTEQPERFKTIPAGGPYSVAYLTHTGRGQQAAERFEGAGCRIEDIPQLRREAAALVKAARDTARGEVS